MVFKKIKGLRLGPGGSEGSEQVEGEEATEESFDVITDNLGSIGRWILSRYLSSCSLCTPVFAHFLVLQFTRLRNCVNAHLDIPSKTNSVDIYHIYYFPWLLTRYLLVYVLSRPRYNDLLTFTVRGTHII